MEIRSPKMFNGNVTRYSNLSIDIVAVISFMNQVTFACLDITRKSDKNKHI